MRKYIFAILVKMKKYISFWVKSANERWNGGAGRKVILLILLLYYYYYYLLLILLPTTATTTYYYYQQLLLLLLQLLLTTSKAIYIHVAVLRIAAVLRRGSATCPSSRGKYWCLCKPTCKPLLNSPESLISSSEIQDRDHMIIICYVAEALLYAPSPK